MGRWLTWYDGGMKVKVNGIYRHYKGDLYLVVDVARHSETLEEMVIYSGVV